MELAVEAPDNICCVYDFPGLGRVFIEGAQNISVILPTFHAGEILLPPFLPEVEQVFLRLVQGHGGVDLLQVRHHLLDVLPTDKGLHFLLLSGL